MGVFGSPVNLVDVKGALEGVGTLATVYALQLREILVQRKRPKLSL